MNTVYNYSCAQWIQWTIMKYLFYTIWFCFDLWLWNGSLCQSFKITSPLFLGYHCFWCQLLISKSSVFYGNRIRYQVIENHVIERTQFVSIIQWWIQQIITKTLLCYHFRIYGIESGFHLRLIADTRNTVGNSSTMSQLRARRKAAKMLVVVVVMFAICYLPVHCLNILR